MLSDHLGTPRQVINSAKQLRWRWDNIDPFGANVANQNPSGLGVFSYNLRFPGQHYDSETRLFYNYFRDYSPNLGRYLESDPIGLRGGVNTFGYVGGNPLRFVDLLGLYSSDGTISIPIPIFSPPSMGGNKNSSHSDSDSSDSRGRGGRSVERPQRSERSCPSKQDPCRQPDSVYDVVDDKGKIIGIILYKDIPYGAFINAPLRAGSCGSVVKSLMSVTGGAINDLFNLDYW